MASPHDTNSSSSSKPTHEVGDFSWMGQVPGRKSFWERAKEDPLVPIGCGVTLAVLVGGLMTFQRGQSKLGNKFMQARVVAQTGTVVAMSVGGFFAATKKEETKKQPYEERLKIELRD